MLRWRSPSERRRRSGRGAEKQLAAEAAGAESQGMAQVRVKEAEAAALEKQGIAEVARIRESLYAEAQGEEASATALEKKLVAEAAGLKEKADALQAMEGTAREHEEFRIGLEKAHEAELRRIEARVQMARAQAEVLGEAFGQSEFRIVGGDGAFFDRFVKAVSRGEPGRNGRRQQDHADGLRGLPGGERDLRGPHPGPAGVGSSSGSEALKDLSIAATSLSWPPGRTAHSVRNSEPRG